MGHKTQINMKEHYCAHCFAPYKEERCPSCGAKGSLSTPEDPIFYMQADYFLSPRVEDFLKETGIPYLKKGELGAGLTTRIGFSFEHDHYFIPLKAYRDFEEELNLFKDVVKTRE